MAGKPRQVVQCDLSGTEIRSFESASEAASFYGSKYATNIHKAIKYGLTAHGYRWKYEGGMLVDMPKGTPGAKRGIIGINLCTNEEMAFPSISMASRQLGIGITTIESALQTGSKAKGYSFYYADTGPMPKEKKSRTRRAILGLDEKGNIIKTWASAYDAAKELGVIDAAIYGCINSKNPNAKCKGYRLRYK